MNSAYNQMPLEEQSRRFTIFVIGNQLYDFNFLDTLLTLMKSRIDAIQNSSHLQT